MIIAIVVNTRWWRSSIDLDGYAAALMRQGHQVLLVCHHNDAGRAAFPVVEASPERMADGDFWRRLAIDAAIAFTWLRAPHILEAMRASGIRVISRVDGDGQTSVRVFPRAAWLATVSPANSLLDGARRMNHWFRRLLFLYRREDRVTLAAVRASDRVVIESSEAAANLAAVLRYHRSEDLTQKIRVVPHSVYDLFFKHPPGAPQRSPLIFCGGRWDDPQKDAPLLMRTIRAILAHRPDAEFVIGGAEARRIFQPLSRLPGVTLSNQIPREHLPDLLARCRFLLSSSRWESQPVGTLEALCMGASVVAPVLPGFIALADAGRSGTLTPRRNPHSLAHAALEELRLWETGRRNPSDIASRWRPLVNNDAVAASLVATLND